MITTEFFIRKPLVVEAIQVTNENMEELADWCNGTVRVMKRTEGYRKEGTAFIKVDVANPRHDRQTMAFSNDWILRAGTGFKVYTDKAFCESFDKQVTENNPERISVKNNPAIQYSS